MDTKGSPAPPGRAVMALLGEQQRLWRNMLSVPRVIEAAA